MVLREKGSAVTEDQDRLLRVDQRFTSFTSWNLDKPPSGDDRLNKALQWIDIAKAVSVCRMLLIAIGVGWGGVAFIKLLQYCVEGGDQMTCI